MHRSWKHLVEIIAMMTDPGIIAMIVSCGDSGIWP
jgi:hypothetical protein